MTQDTIMVSLVFIGIPASWVALWAFSAWIKYKLGIR